MEAVDYWHRHQTGCTPSLVVLAIRHTATSEVTTTNNTWGSFPVMYNSCSGSAFPWLRWVLSMIFFAVQSGQLQIHKMGCHHPYLCTTIRV